MSNPIFQAKVVSILDFDFDRPMDGYEGCLEIVINSIRGLMNLGDAVTLVMGDGKTRHALTLKGASALGDERPGSLRTGELPLLLEKSPELASTRVKYEPGMTLESTRSDPE